MTCESETAKSPSSLGSVVDAPSACLAQMISRSAASAVRRWSILQRRAMLHLRRQLRRSRRLSRTNPSVFSVRWATSSGRVRE